MLTIAAGGEQSTNDSIRASAALLGGRAKIAKAAKGKGDELSTQLNLGTSALDLQTACTNAGYYR